MAIASRYCPRCQRFVRSQRGQPNNVLHLALSLFTLGLWLPVWLLLALNQVWHCDECGGKTYASKAGLWIERFILLVFFGLVGLIALIVLVGRR